MWWKSNFPYYFSIFFPIFFYGLVFVWLFGKSTTAELNTGWDITLFILKFFWLSGFLVSVSNIIGLLYYGNPRLKNEEAISTFRQNGWDQDKLLVVVYVSRGDNVMALERSIYSTANLLSSLNVRHRIDVVTDLPVSQFIQPQKQATKYHLVPEGYATVHNAKWKARALHYVVEERKIDVQVYSSPSTWILHLDEESAMTESCVAGISQFISDPENKDSIGQGEIKYNAHNYGKHLLITWADSIRSGDDLGRFRFQFGLFNAPLFGMHGSYILAPLHIEQRFGFDLGGRGSVTEDAYFALKCAESGTKFKWISGYIREQSPYSIMALAKQRRRWFSGLLMLSFDKKICLRVRLPLMLNTVLWSVAWMGPVVTIIALIFGGYFPVTLLVVAALMQGFYTSTYMVGALRNIIDVKEELSLVRKISIWFGSMFAVHVVNAIEGFSVLYALMRPVKTFDVVNKN